MCRHPSVFLLGTLAALTALVSGTSGCSGKGESLLQESMAEEEFSPMPTVPGDGLAPGTYQLVEVGVVVRDRKKDGDAWDSPGALPDPRIEVVVDGDKLTSCTVQDQLRASCKPRSELEISASTTIEFLVHDSDVSMDDPVGMARIDGLTGHGQEKTHLPMQVKGQLAEAYLVFGQPPTWFDEYKWRLLGLLVGIAFGLALLRAFKDFWFRKKPARRKKKRASSQDDEDDGEDEDDTGERSSTGEREAGIYKLRCSSCGAMSSSERQRCEYCGEPLREKEGHAR